MELTTIKLQKVKGSYFAYLPKKWVKFKELKKGSKLTWYLNENENLILEIAKEE